MVLSRIDQIPVFNLVFFALFFLIAIFFSVLINFLILRFTRNLGMRDMQEAGEQIRWSSESKPSLGGFSFYIVFLISIAVLGIAPMDGNEYFSKELIGLLVASSLGFLLGLADDAYNTNPLVKFIGQFTCASLLILTGFTIEATNIAELNYLLSMLWVIGLMNSINMLDNMDAITTSVSISILLGAVLLILLDGHINNHYLIIILGVLGSLIGFLFFNWHPSKMYMGDTGSQFLGVLLAGISMLFFWNFRSNNIEFFELRQFIIPALLFIVPLIDTTTVFIRRLARKQSPFVGGKDHITHHLAYLGLSDRWVAVTLLLISLLSIPLVYLVYKNFEDWKFQYTLFAIAYCLVLFIVFQLLYNKGKKLQAQKNNQ